ncbi:LysR substrate-binding domain-containing protein [Nonomuraea dietziae]|uniref:LysR substrate-binding domain-containing protein n=1 Tax=Nonomuraea dietziae TaxID=65515 RepID=UPI00341CB506
MGFTAITTGTPVSSLERELGAPLFVRHRDGIALTEAGRRALARAREVLRHFDLIRADVAAAAGEITRKLRLASLPSATDTLIAHRLRAFTDRYPQLQVRLSEGVNDDVCARVRPRSTWSRSRPLASTPSR